MQHTKYLYFIFFVVLTQSCSSALTSNTIENENFQDELMLEILCEMGFDISAATFVDEYILIDDIVFDRRKLETQEISRINKHNVQNRGVLVAIDNHYLHINNTSNISYVVHPDFESNQNYVNALDKVIADYENISDCRLNFNKISYSGGILNNGLNIMTDKDTLAPPCLAQMGSNWDGKAFFPSGGYIGKFLALRKSISNETPCYLEKLLKHEIGHTLGMLHTNTFRNGPLACVPNGIGMEIQGTSDLLSIMVEGINSVTGCRDFSSDDRYAMQALFPQSYSPGNLVLYNHIITPATSTTAKWSCEFWTSTSSPTYKILLEVFDASGSRFHYSIFYTRDGTSGTRKLHHKRIPYGSYQVKATFYNFNGDYDVVSNSININI